ncbi:hypothetical protein TCON_2089 [Astathelohania contejeani]|uniref:Uncharacterized protein n=1 Tax=Astathelohania contejeani TaxID=164912 RepID=A0ABQ7HWZ8_9MICR|nr:hypothetical protein TCON_2089 [Thelohania contejeani]
MGQCGVVTKYHRNYLMELNIIFTIERYIQLTVLKKTLETISLEYKRSIEDDMDTRDRVEEAVKRFGEVSTTGCQPQAIEKKDKKQHNTKPVIKCLYLNNYDYINLFKI